MNELRTNGSEEGLSEVGPGRSAGVRRFRSMPLPGPGGGIVGWERNANPHAGLPAETSISLATVASCVRVSRTGAPPPDPAYTALLGARRSQAPDGSRLSPAVTCHPLPNKAPERCRDRRDLKGQQLGVGLQSPGIEPPLAMGEKVDADQLGVAAAGDAAPKLPYGPFRSHRHEVGRRESGEPHHNE
jgi:hypothetical protein